MKKTFWLRWTNPARLIRYSSGSIPAAKVPTKLAAAPMIARTRPNIGTVHRFDFAEKFGRSRTRANKRE
jgi:hypothetical protein